jgi:TatD DNase family protein
MFFIDTHAHLYASEFDEDRSEMIERAISLGVEQFLLPNIDENSIAGMHQLAKDYPSRCYAMMGVHPSSVEADWQEQLQRIQSYFDPNIHIAIGEIGIDLYWDKSLQKEQTLAFEQQIIWAKNVGLPIVIHARDSFDEIFEVVDQHNDDQLTGVFHCFTGDLTQAQKIIDYGGFKLGIGGVATFKNGGLDKVLPPIDLKHLILETDSPYLAPVPYRGKRNESSYIPLIAERLSEFYDVPLSTIANVTTASAQELFKLKLL